MIDFIIGLVPFAVVIFAVVSILVAVFLRRVVEPNEVHVVQSAKGRKSYGKEAHGNTYWEFPSWIPVIGLTKIVLPVSVFDLELGDYEAYDKDRVPFNVDVMAFFRIEDTDVAAERVTNFEELQEQLMSVMQGAVRTILAGDDIDSIMLNRSKYSDAFTIEVDKHLEEWGVKTAKTIELMDIRDAHESKVIHNIMEKKKSFIEMESRIEVSTNKKNAEVAEIQNGRDADIEQEQARQKVFVEQAQADKNIGIAKEQSEQEVKSQAKITAEKDMAIKQVEQVKQADITKEVEVVQANQDKETKVIIAEGDLAAKEKEAKGIEVEGSARAAAEKAMQLAPVEAQIVLAKEIGDNDGYQKYLISVDAISASKAIGIEQAEALQQADVKVISNSGNATEGLNGVMDLFTSKGGTNLTAMLEGLSQSEHGAALLAKFGIKPEDIKPAIENVDLPASYPEDKS